MNRGSAFLLPLALILGGCFGMMGGSESTITVYSPHGAELLSAFEKEYEASHPGVDVICLDMGSQVVLDRIRSERRSPQADVWWGAPQNLFMSAAEEDLLEPYTPTWAGHIDPTERDPDWRWAGTFLTPQVILYNATRVTEDEAPKRWDDLLDEKWMDKITIRYPLASGGMRGVFGAIIQRESTEAGMDGALSWLARLDVNTRSYPTSPALMFEEITRGQGVISIWNLPDVILQEKRYKRPFGYHIPAGGTLVIVDGIALIKGGPNPEGGREFYEFVTSVPAFVRQAENFHRIPTRTDIPSAELPEWMRNLRIPRMPIDWDALSEQSDQWMQTWDAEIKNRGKRWLADHPQSATPQQ